MAIDDNTVYGLTGAQVKELPEKINKLKGEAKILTTADYNWPADNPTGVALWLLGYGLYEWETGTVVYEYRTSSSPVQSTQRGALVSNDALADHKLIVTFKGEGVSMSDTSSNYGGLTREVYASGTSAGMTRSTWQLLTSSTIEKRFKSTNERVPLAASAGKELREMFIALPMTDSDFNTLWEEA